MVVGVDGLRRHKPPGLVRGCVHSRGRGRDGGTGVGVGVGERNLQ